MTDDPVGRLEEKLLKIVFWGCTRGCGTTSSLVAVASYVAYHAKLRVAMIQLEKEEKCLKEYFSLSETSYVKENNDYYALKGLDYLLEMGRKQTLNGRMVAENMEPLIKNRLYSLSYNQRATATFKVEYRDYMLQQIIATLDKGMDLVFVDVGTRMDEWTRKLIKEADLLVVSMQQEGELFDKFFLEYANLAANMVFLVGNYRKEGLYNRRNLHRIYRIPENQLVVVPFNPEFQQACEKGRVDKYMKDRQSIYRSENRTYFMRELQNTMDIILKQSKI